MSPGRDSGEAENLQHTAAGAIMGTPGYMAPEQARGEAVDARTDVFALGSILATILTGRPAFVGSSRMETIQKSAAADLADVRQRLHHCGADAELLALAERALAADAKARPDDGRAVAAEVAAYRAGVEARLRQAETERAQALVREAEQRKRRRVWIGLAASLLLGVLGSLALAAWAVREKGRADATAQAEREARLELATEQTRTAQQRDLAQQNLALAIEAANKVVTGIAEHPRLVEADFSDIRKQLLGLAVPMFEEFVKQRSDDPDLAAGRGRAYGRLAVVRAEIGESAAAMADYEQAWRIFAQLAADFPSRPEFRHDLAKSHNNRGILLSDTGRLKEAEAAYADALAIQKQLAADFPSRPEFRQELATSHNNRGNLLSATGRLKEAEAAYADALAIYKQLAADFPKVPDYHNETAGTLGNLAHLLNQRRDFAAARRKLDEALPYHQAALRANPRHPTYRQVYRNNLHALTSSCAGLGERSAAVAAAQKRRDLGWDPPADAYDAAYVLAQCVPIVKANDRLDADQRQAEVAFYGDEAMKLLREAVAKGFKNAAQMKKEADLAPLRERKDFQQLVADLEKR